MGRIVTVSGSPSPTSRSHLLAQWIGARLAAEGFEVASLSVCDLPAEDLLWCRGNAPGLRGALDLIKQAEGVVIVTPVYNASYTGALKALLDVLPQRGLAGKVVLPLAVGGSIGHLLAIDYALRPVLTVLGTLHVVSGTFAVEKLLQRTEEGLQIEAELRERLVSVMDEFALCVRRHHGGAADPRSGSAWQEQVPGGNGRDRAAAPQH